MLVDWGISIRRACKVLRFDASTYHYKSRRTGQAPLERRIKEICETRVRYGYRRVHVHLRRDGWKINMKKTRRIYSEFISRDLDLWAYANNVTLDFSRPGKPTDNGFIEAFNSKLRSECLNAHWFLTLADSREKLETWRRYYNEERPHSAIGYNVPIDLHNPGGATSPPS